MKLMLPYGIRLGHQGKFEVVPIVRVRIRSAKKKEVPGIFVIDSGATTTFLPSTDAEALDLDLKSGDQILVRGVAGQLLGYRHELTLVIEDVVLRRVPVIIADHPEVPRILGRESIFSHFGIFFDEAKRRTLFLDNKERKTIDSLFRKK